MATNFDEVKELVKSLPAKKIAIVCANDVEVLAAIREAKDQGLADAILTGDEKEIRGLAEEKKIDITDFEVINEPDMVKAATLCCALVRENKAQVIMKGLIDTSKFMRAVLNKETGLNKGGLISHVAAFEAPNYSKLLLVTDAAINVAPTLDDKVKIINNSVSFAKALGIETPLVACVAAVEKVNAKAMPATVDAALLAKMSDRNQITGCIVDGPFGLDNAICEESARIKKIVSPVAGKADIILCNDIESGNYLYKTLATLVKAKAGACVLGASAPIVLTSRADSHEAKFLSIVVATLSA
ncbi:MAG: bifunctional enoyl-CoA hydratase/phosphate acetyltransferase [Bacteriovoracaceae bacterium]|nr:bifunctional enoyl-CoA hydratase/phosphate acetyltransferase [Bacteriovoracaceae bacterium]